MLQKRVPYFLVKRIGLSIISWEITLKSKNKWGLMQSHFPTTGSIKLGELHSRPDWISSRFYFSHCDITSEWNQRPSPNGKLWKIISAKKESTLTDKNIFKKLEKGHDGNPQELHQLQIKSNNGKLLPIITLHFNLYTIIDLSLSIFMFLFCRIPVLPRDKMDR